MNEEDRIAAYLTERARTVEIAPNDVHNITDRAAHRHHTHRALGAVAAVAVVVLAAGALAVVTRSPSRQSVSVAGTPGVNRSELKWSTVDVPDGLGWSSSSVAASDGSLFSLSTAPGPASMDPGKVNGEPPTLYRSTDGRSWNAVGLPADLSASGLAAADGHLYAVGTAPGGGGIDIVVASSNDGAQTWTEARIPQPVAALKAQFPSEVNISAPVVTAGPHGLVAAVSVTAYPDLNRLLPNDGPFASWRYTDTGVDVFGDRNNSGGCLSVPSLNSSDGSADPSSESANSTAGSESPTTSSGAKASGAPVCEKQAPQITKSYTWDQLNLDPGLRALIGGEVHTYTSSDGSSYAETVSSGLPSGFVAALVGSSDGYRMLVSDVSSTALHPLFSADGQTWTAGGPDLSGWVRTSGLLGSSPAAVVEMTKDNNAQLLVGTSGGGWTVTDMGITGASSPNAAGGQVYLQDVVIGPLGVVALASGDITTAAVYESVDGVHFIRHPLSDLAGTGNWSPAGITMNADAVIIRMLPPADPNQAAPSTPGPQRLLVGVPG